LANEAGFVFSVCQEINAGQDGKHDDSYYCLEQAGSNFLHYQEAHNQHDEGKNVIFKMIHVFSLDVMISKLGEILVG
jgi:hypothetical protein